MKNVTVTDKSSYEFRLLSKYSKARELAEDEVCYCVFPDVSRFLSKDSSHRGYFQASLQRSPYRAQNPQSNHKNKVQYTPSHFFLTKAVIGIRPNVLITAILKPLDLIFPDLKVWLPTFLSVSNPAVLFRLKQEKYTHTLKTGKLSAKTILSLLCDPICLLEYTRLQLVLLLRIFRRLGLILLRKPLQQNHCQSKMTASNSCLKEVCRLESLLNEKENHKSTDTQKGNFQNS